MASTHPHNSGTWVDVAFVQWDADEHDDLPEWGDHDAMAQYLAQWDFGTETDYAHTVTPHLAPWHSSDPGDDDGLIRYPWGSSDETFDVTVDGLDYVLSYHRHLRYASLSRRPLTTTAGV